MDRIDAIRIFTRVVERRSFAQAAHDLALPRSRASEALQQLERQLGVRLLTRTTRQVSPTPEGQEYFARCKSILADLDAAETAVTDRTPHGPLRIHVHGTFARRFLLPHLTDFLDKYPGILLHIGEGDGLVDLIRDGVDCVIRVGEPADSGLVGRRLGMLDEGTFASPSYLGRYGTPSSPDDLVGHVMIGFVSTKTRLVIPLEFQTPQGVSIVSVPPKITVTGADTMACLAINGHGLIQVPRYRVATELHEGLLVEVLPQFRPTSSPVYILHAEGSHISPRTKVFLDWAVRVIGQDLAEARRASNTAGAWR